jgi:hypothetical protein
MLNSAQQNGKKKGSASVFILACLNSVFSFLAAQWKLLATWFGSLHTLYQLVIAISLSIGSNILFLKILIDYLHSR